MAVYCPLQNFNKVALTVHFIYMYEIYWAHVLCQDVQKILLEPWPKLNRKSAILNLLCIFGDFHMLYFNELPNEIIS